VTRSALPGRAFEDASHVAGFAARDLVRSGQGEAGAEMVETAGRLRADRIRREPSHDNQDDCQQREQYRPRLF